nr:LytTR family DNA-binding domain-containing protein [uncultured Rhodoferax sp.]
MNRVLIADDELHLARYLQQQLLVMWPEVDIVALAANGLEAARLIDELQPDVAFLDIQMPGLTGLEVAQGIEGPTRVVFVTAYDEYAVQAFDQAAVDYVLKPIKTERLEQAVRRVQAALGTTAPEPGEELVQALRHMAPTPPDQPLRFVRASQGELTHQIDVSDVLYFHADDKYTCVQTAQAEYLIRTPIAELAIQLDPNCFWQVHRSTLINLTHLAGTRRDSASRVFVRFKQHPRELPVSRAYVHRFKAM